MSDGTYNRPSRLFDQRGQASRGQEARDMRRLDPGVDERRSGGASDPLLELARLIGQSDPFGPAGSRDAPPPGESRDRMAQAPQDRGAQDRPLFPPRPPSRDFAPEADAPAEERPPQERP